MQRSVNQITLELRTDLKETPRIFTEYCLKRYESLYKKIGEFQRVQRLCDEYKQRKDN